MTKANVSLGFKAVDCWVNPNLGAPPGGDVDYLFPGIAERWRRGTTLPQLIDEMDAAGIEKSVLVSGFGYGDTEAWVKDAIRRHPDRLAGSHVVDPREGMKAVRQIESLVKDHGYKLIRMMAFLFQAGYDDAICYPVYAKCVELGVPISLNVGIPGPRVPSKCQDPMALDAVCHFFPQLTVIMSHGGEPWTELCIKLMLKWPNLFYMTSAFSPKRVPASVIHYLNSRGRDRVMFASDYPVFTFERCIGEIAALPLKDEATREAFAAGNALRVIFGEEVTVAR